MGQVRVLGAICFVCQPLTAPAHLHNASTRPTILGVLHTNTSMPTLEELLRDGAPVRQASGRLRHGRTGRFVALGSLLV